VIAQRPPRPGPEPKLPTPVADTVQKEGQGGAEFREITPAAFALLRDLIYRESGIHLADEKASLLTARLGRRLRTLGLDSFDAYYEHLMGTADGEMTRMLDCITTNETHFFREARQFEFLETKVFPAWRREGERGMRTKRVRAWSAACSTGEEAYSLAMSMLHHFPRSEGWSVDVLGTDISNRALQVAREGIWALEQAGHIPPIHLRRFMRRGVRSQDGRMRAGEELRSVVRIEHLNLHAESYHLTGGFDVVFCRNVLIYFAEVARTSALQRIVGLVGDGGYLLLGHAENPGRNVAPLESMQTMIYRRRPAGAPRMAP